MISDKNEAVNATRNATPKGRPCEECHGQSSVLCRLPYIVLFLYKDTFFEKKRKWMRLSNVFWFMMRAKGLESEKNFFGDVNCKKIVYICM